jgi:hypothetical protein
MRALTVALLFAITLNAFGQGIPQLPYNPDENGDGLIGVPDLQALLSQYGLEFNSAVLSEDAQSAIVYMGEMAHPVCSQACDNLPGFWNMATMADLGLVWDEITVASSTWVNSTEVFYNSPYFVAAYHFFEGQIASHAITIHPNLPYRCYCAAHELPKVEYFKCIGYGSDAIEECVLCAQQKVSEGWYPLSPSTATTQDLWRWAD